MILSIAIPAYNAAKSLERTVQSILAQTFTDFEVLIVNNGSVDNTGEVARALAAKDSRIQVFDVYPNIQGYGARLYAWRRAKGAFITSVDADDWIEPDMYETMLGTIEANGLDVLQCDIFGREKDPRGGLELFEGEALKNEIFRKFIDVGEGAYIWNKVYRNRYDFFQWKEGNFGSYEDLIHNLQLFYPVKKYGYLHKGFYHYEVTPTSVTKNFNIARLGQFSNAAKAKRELVAGHGVAADDDVVDRWIVNDLRNAFITAATVGKPAWSERLANVRAVLGMQELKESMGKLKRDCRGRRLLGLAMRHPSLVTIGVRLLKKLKV